MPFIGDIGVPGLIIILIIALLVLGPGKLPEVGEALGRGIREFRRATDITGDKPAATQIVRNESPEQAIARLTKERDTLAAELRAKDDISSPTEDARAT